MVFVCRQCLRHQKRSLGVSAAGAIQHSQAYQKSVLHRMSVGHYVLLGQTLQQETLDEVKTKQHLGYPVVHTI